MGRGVEAEEVWSWCRSSSAKARACDTPLGARTRSQTSQSATSWSPHTPPPHSDLPLVKQIEKAKNWTRPTTVKRKRRARLSNAAWQLAVSLTPGRVGGGGGAGSDSLGRKYILIVNETAYQFRPYQSSWSRSQRCEGGMHRPMKIKSVAPNNIRIRQKLTDSDSAFSPKYCKIESETVSQNSFDLIKISDIQRLDNMTSNTETR